MSCISAWCIILCTTMLQKCKTVRAVTEMWTSRPGNGERGEPGNEVVGVPSLQRLRGPGGSGDENG